MNEGKERKGKERKGYEMEAVVALTKYYHRICMEGRRKTTKPLSRDSVCTYLDSNRIPAEHKSVTLVGEIVMYAPAL
jgi:hypothetical protein